MYDGNQWKLENRGDALQRLYDDKSGILETKFEELIETLNRSAIEKFQRFLDATNDNGDGSDDTIRTNQHVQSIKKELKKILYENRNITSQTRKLNEIFT